MTRDRELTGHGRKKIVRLLESGKPQNIDMALLLIEEAYNTADDISKLFTKEIIIALICLEDPLVTVRTGSLISKCTETWKTFANALANPFVMTSRDFRIRTVDLSEVTAFSQEALTELVKDTFEIDLSGLTSLSPEKARLLGTHRGPLLLNGLKEITDECAKNLSKHVGDLSLNALSELSDTSAKSLGNHDGNLFLGGLTELSDHSAKNLAKHTGNLSLPALTEVSESGALELVSHNSLRTNAIIKRKIKKAVSNRNQHTRKSSSTGKSALTKTQKAKMRKLLRSKSAENVKVAVQLIDISEATKDDISDVLSASVLSQLVNTWDIGIWNSLAPLLNSYPHAKREFTELAENRLHQKLDSSYKQQTEAKEFLNGFYKDLTRPTALLELKFMDFIPSTLYTLYLDLTELSDAAAESFIGHKGCLWFYYLTALSDSAAESLSRFKGDLYLSSITSLSDAAAQSLGNHEGDIHLSNLTALSDVGAMSLSKHRGHIDLCLTDIPNMISVLIDDNSYSSSPGHVSLLKKLVGDDLLNNSEIGFDSLTSLGDFAAEILSEYKGSLGLSGLTDISDSAAKSLSKHQGLPTYRYNGYDNAKLDGLDLSGLTTSCNSTIKSLAKSKGRLNLSGLKQLSDVAAESLSNHDGILVLNGITELSDASALSLSKHELHLELRGVTSISDAGAKFLGENQRRMAGGGPYHKYSQYLHDATGVYIR